MSSFDEVEEFSGIPAVVTVNFYNRVYQDFVDFCEGATDSDIPVRKGIRSVEIR